MKPLRSHGAADRTGSAVHLKMRVLPDLQETPQHFANWTPFKNIACMPAALLSRAYLGTLSELNFQNSEMTLCGLVVKSLHQGSGEVALSLHR